MMRKKTAAKGLRRIGHRAVRVTRSRLPVASNRKPETANPMVPCRATVNTALAMVLMALVWAGPALALDAKTIVRLHKAGLSDATIAAITRTKAIETGLTTVDQIEKMRGAGIGDETIRLMVENGAFAHNSPKIYGQTTRSIETMTLQDLIGLKEAGFSDAVIQAIIVYRAAETGDADRHRAWQMLTGMGLISDQR